MRIAFAGTGGINKTHARAAKKLGLDLVATVNHRPETMAAFAKEFGIPRQYATIEDLLKDADLHTSQTITALNAGVHVMVEKPMAMNVQGTEEMVRAAEKSGKALMVAQCWRFYPEVQWLTEQSSRLGQSIRTKAYSVHIHWVPAGWKAG